MEFLGLLLQRVSVILSCYLEGHLGTIHILRNHIFRIFGPPSPLRNHVFSTENNQKLAFSDPPSPPTSDYVIYEWSLISTQ